MSVPRRALLGFLHVALVEQGGAPQGTVAGVGRRGRNGLPGQLPAPPEAEVHVQARPPVEGQRVQEGLHGVQDALGERSKDRSAPMEEEEETTSMGGTVTHHDEPGDEGRVSDVPETAVVDVRLHLQVEEEAFVDDVGKPARRAAEEREKKKSTSGDKHSMEAPSCE